MADNPFPQVLFGACRSTDITGPGSLTDGVIVPGNTPYLLPGTPALIYLDFGVVNTGSTGEKYAHIFQFRMPFAWTTGGRVRAKIRWEVSTIGPAGSIGRPFFRLQKNGAAISGVTNGVGVNKALDVLGVYDDYHVVCDLPRGTSFANGDTLDFLVGLEITTAAAGAILVTRIRVDPSIADDALCFEPDGFVVY